MSMILLFWFFSTFTELLTNFIPQYDLLGKDHHTVAFVEYLKSKGKTDEITNCEMFEWERMSNRFSIVDIGNILKIVNMLPLYKSNSSIDHYDDHLLNKFIFN